MQQQEQQHRVETKVAYQFYQNLPGFLKDLLARPVEADTCWSCGLKESWRDLVGYRLDKDFRDLGLRYKNRPKTFDLCWDCARRYMRSFNIAHHKKQGLKGCPCCWGIEE